jgi:hypothetical protein
MRGAKSLHPYGVVCEARLSVTGASWAPRGAQLLRQAGEHPALVRFSRALGLPEPLPDLLGMSIRVPDAYGPNRDQDFLLVSSADLPVIHHLFLPTRDPRGRPYTSSLPYRAGSEHFLVGAVPAGPRRYDLAVAPLMGRFRPVATLEVGDALPDEANAITFNPANTGGGLEAEGFLNRVRSIAYPLSQRGWRSSDSARRT